MSAINLADPYNRELMESTYQQWQSDPGSVDPTWQAFFTGMEFAGTGPRINGTHRGPTMAASANGQPSGDAELRLQTGVVRLVSWYRQAGHLMAHIDPLQDSPPLPHPLLALTNFGLSDADLGKTVDPDLLLTTAGSTVSSPATLGDLLAALQETYCRTTGYEFMHIDDLATRNWLLQRIEPTRNRPNLSRRDRYRTLMTLHWAALFESFLHTKFVGQKRFSLEGAETLIPMLDAIVERSPGLGIEEIVIGMAHRGRLNVLTNILHKPFQEIFNEFEDTYLPESTKDGDGDVKYHMGFSADVETSDGGSVHLSLSPNPSHLEAVNPVVEGRVRAKQRLFGDFDRGRGVPLLIHGDAAFAGQGLVPETLNMANLQGYRTGGTVHIVVNNQIGFTTSPRDARSTEYCTDIAKFIQAPIFHVNAEDPEAAVAAARLALEFRQEYKKDVVIDLVCFRKYGHNEGDEPAYTQPVIYKQIKKKKPVQVVYTDQLLADGKFEQAEADAIDAEFRGHLDRALKEVKDGPPKPKRMPAFAGRWTGLAQRYTHESADTAVNEAVLDRIANQLATVPDGFNLHPTLKRIVETRRDNVLGRKAVDWGTGEALAFGSLLLDGHAVRLSGQDSRRGTFSHRHAHYFDFETGKAYCPLSHLDPNRQAPFDAFDSCLSEAAVLGFEYGYSLDDPNTLVLWEAQFGDFANGAQVIIDQFIASGESKWNRASGIVLLLPHGYEGQGPEHSSARLERFLQACAEDNQQVVNLTTPAQLFHALRRQMKRSFRKPLVVMTPKSLLRHPKAVSPIADFSVQQFREVIDDPTADPDKVDRVVLCSGKVYYDLLAARDEAERADIAIVRLEQIYPWPEEQLKTVINRYNGASLVWAQEESHNMGAWFFAEPRLRGIGLDIGYVGRDASASPASGSHFVHKHEQAELVRAAFDDRPPVYVAAGRNDRVPPRREPARAEAAAR